MKAKLIDELTELVKNKVISEAVAADIRAYYQSGPTDAPTKLYMIFGILGSLLVGLGTILILAHNWDGFPRTVKTMLAFLPLVLGQCIEGYAIVKKKNAAWKEAAGTFLFLAVGCSIALVSQIYNIPGDLGQYVLTWIVLCLPLIYLLDSHAVALLHIAFSTFYACHLGYGYSHAGTSPWLYFGLLAVVMPQYLGLLKNHRERHVTALFNWALPLSLTIVLGAFVTSYDGYGYLLYLLLFGVFYLIGKRPIFEAMQLRRNGYVVFGSVGTVMLLLITSFATIWEFGFGADLVLSQELVLAAVLFVACSVLWWEAYSKRWLQGFRLFPVVYLVFSFLFFIGMGNALVPTILVNVLVFALGLETIKIGADKMHFGILNYGLCIITALIACRFFDTDMSYILRGLLFVGVGIGFFLTNHALLKRKKTFMDPKP